MSGTAAARECGSICSSLRQLAGMAGRQLHGLLLLLHTVKSSPNPPHLHVPCAEWRLGRPLSFDGSSGAAGHAHMRLPSDDSAAEGYMGAAYGSNGTGGDLEMSGLVLKTYAADDDRHA